MRLLDFDLIIVGTYDTRAKNLNISKLCEMPTTKNASPISRTLKELIFRSSGVNFTNIFLEI